MTKIEVRQPRKTNLAAGGMLIVAMVIMFTGAAIGFFAPSLRDAPWADNAHEATTTIAGNPSAYMWANGLIMAAAILTALALVPLSLGFAGRARPWAWTATVAFAFAAMFEAIDRIIRMQVHTWAVQQQHDLADPVVRPFIRFQAGLSDSFFILGFAALGLYGVAMLVQSGVGGIGWLFIVGSIFGIVLHVSDATIPAMVFLGTGALGVTALIFDFATEPIR